MQGRRGERQSERLATDLTRNVILTAIYRGRRNDKKQE